MVSISGHRASLLVWAHTPLQHTHRPRYEGASVERTGRRQLLLFLSTPADPGYRTPWPADGCELAAPARSQCTVTALSGQAGQMLPPTRQETLACVCTRPHAGEHTSCRVGVRHTRATCRATDVRLRWRALFSPPWFIWQRYLVEGKPQAVVPANAWQQRDAARGLPPAGAGQSIRWQARQEDFPVDGPVAGRHWSSAAVLCVPPHDGRVQQRDRRLREGLL